jgi:hypothetical protein
MSDDKYVSRKVVLPKFSGAHKDFQVWWTRFLAFASVCRFSMQAVGNQAEVDPPYLARVQTASKLMPVVGTCA